MDLMVLQEHVTHCRLCPRLVAYREEVAHVKRRAYRDWIYWGRPVPAFGDPAARVLVVGLAPAAHGANRTGRMFTGDRTGDFLFRAMHAVGFASQPASSNRNDGLTLSDAYLTSAVRCAPPDNMPTREETATCRRYLDRELDLLPTVRVVVVLGGFAHGVYLSLLRDRGLIRSRAAFPFGHNVAHDLGPSLPVLLCSYHPSQQNTSTGRLTDAMLREVFEHARRLLDGAAAR